MQVLRRNEIDIDLWNAAVDRDPSCLPYGLTAWLDATTDEWLGLVEGNYASVFPLPMSKTLGITWSGQPPYVQQLGWFGDDSSSSIAWNSLVQGIDLNLKQTVNLAPEAEESTLFNTVLPINESIEELRNAYSKNHIRNLKRDAQQVTISAISDAKQIIELFMSQKGAQLGLSKKYKDRLNRLLNIQDDRVSFTFFEARGEAEFLGGLICSHYRGRHILLMLSVGESGRSSGVSVKLIDHYLSLYAGNSGLFDFEGAKDPGLARFYAGFGGITQEYYHIAASRWGLDKCMKLYKKLSSR